MSDTPVFDLGEALYYIDHRLDRDLDFACDRVEREDLVHIAALRSALGSIPREKIADLQAACEENAAQRFAEIAEYYDEDEDEDDPSPSLPWWHSLSTAEFEEMKAHNGDGGPWWLQLSTEEFEAQRAEAIRMATADNT